MLDDLTFAGRVEGINGPPDWMMPLDTPSRAPRRWGTSGPNGLFVSVAETGVVSVRLSVPRWLHDHPVNYPLMPIDNVEQLGLRRLRQGIAQTLHLPTSAVGSELAVRFPVERWAVIRSSHAVDLHVSDPLRVAHGCLGIQRRYRSRIDTHGSPTTSTIAWYTKSLSAKFYVKGLELQSHLKAKKNAADRTRIEQLVEHAKHSLRFEVTLRQAQGLRRLFGTRIGDHLPTLALMCDPRIDGWVLAREAYRLRLGDPQSGADRTLFASHVREVVGKLREGQSRLSAGDLTLGRRKTLTPQRLNDLIALYFVASAYPINEAAELTGKSVSAVREALGELRRLGVPPDASPFSTMGAAITEIAQALSPYLPDTFPPDLPDFDPAVAFVTPPWKAEDISFDEFTDDESRDPDEEDEESDSTEAAHAGPGLAEGRPASASELDIEAILRQLTA